MFQLFLSGQRREPLGVKLSVLRHWGPAPSASSLAVLALTLHEFLWSFFPPSCLVLFSSQKIVCLFLPLLFAQGGWDGRVRRAAGASLPITWFVQQPLSPGAAKCPHISGDIKLVIFQRLWEFLLAVGGWALRAEPFWGALCRCFIARRLPLPFRGAPSD